jgi:hypothetical protein
MASRRKFYSLVFSLELMRTVTVSTKAGLVGEDGMHLLCWRYNPAKFKAQRPDP